MKEAGQQQKKEEEEGEKKNNIETKKIYFLCDNRMVWN
jgi:hypothetical protein